MGRGVKKGTIRGDYRRHNKPRLAKLAQDIRANDLDPEAVANAFEARGDIWCLEIAKQLRGGAQFDPERLANAVLRLSDPISPVRKIKLLTLRQAKAALRHLPPELGGKGMSIHAAFGIDYPYAGDSDLRAYHRKMKKDYGKGDRRSSEVELANTWPSRTLGRFPKLEQAVCESLRGYGVPIEIWRAVRRKR